MEHQPFKISYSIATKLVLSLVVLVLIAIAVLNTSAIVLLREDKKAYIFQNQASHVALVGGNLNHTIRHGLDTLKAALGSFDPTASPSPRNKVVLETVIQNQSDFESIHCTLVNIQTGQSTLLVNSQLPQFATYGLTAEAQSIPSVTMQQILPDLIKSGFSLINFSKPNLPPLLGVVFADLKNKEFSGGLPIALGFMNLTGFSKSLSDLAITVTNTTGWILFDTDQSRLVSNASMGESALFRTAAQSKFDTGAIEFELNGNQMLGSFDRPGFDLIVLATENWREAMKATYALTEKYILMGMLVLCLAVIFAIIFSKTITAPVLRLFNATKAVSQGNFELSLKRNTNDEIGALTDSFGAMSKKIVLLIKESMDKVQLQNELAIASAVQQTLLPENYYHDDQIEISSLYQSATQCGGDWWGHFRHGNKICLMIADATGHGLPSALITASARSCLSVLEALVKEDAGFSLRPENMLYYANRVIFEASRGKIMMTFFVGVIDLDKNEISYANAGHNPPWLFKTKDGGTHLISLVSRGIRLGETLDIQKSEFEVKTQEISQLDILVLYTDGLIEGKNSEGNMYGKKRMRQVLVKSLPGGPAKMISALMADFDIHNGKKPLDDDITLAVAKIENLIH